VESHCAEPHEWNSIGLLADSPQAVSDRFWLLRARAARYYSVHPAPTIRISTNRMQNTGPRIAATDAALCLARKLADLSRSDADYWSYKKMAQRPGLHGLVRYPAMMVPRMQADVLDAAIKVLPNLTKVVDPFVGSGTTLVESISRRVAFEGFDINPLAILICRAKLLNLRPATVARRLVALLQRLQDDRSRAIDVQFPGRDKWFSRTACVDLSKIRRAICAESHQRLRQFFWAVLSETIRQTSLSRETTYKLHVRPADAASLVRRPLHCFRELVCDAYVRYVEHYCAAVDASNDKIDASLHCCDIRTVGNLKGPRAQLLLTSPPYGDNQSTIPYGQFSYLALSWIHPDDLEGTPDLYKTAYATDTASLGGSARDYVERAMTMSGVLPTFRAFFQELCKQERPDLEAKAAAFAADLFDAVQASLTRLDADGIAVWTLGERTIGGLRVPMIAICREINEFFGMSAVAEIDRRIQSKRTPHRNSVCTTMVSESLLVMTARPRSQPHSTPASTTF
jgi:hypothetical protein